jgi:hypothetical protein
LKKAILEAKNAAVITEIKALRLPQAQSEKTLMQAA